MNSKYYNYSINMNGKKIKHGFDYHKVSSFTEITIAKYYLFPCKREDGARFYFMKLHLHPTYTALFIFRSKE